MAGPADWGAVPVQDPGPPVTGPAAWGAAALTAAPPPAAKPAAPRQPIAMPAPAFDAAAMAGVPQATGTAEGARRGAEGFARGYGDTPTVFTPEGATTELERSAGRKVPDWARPGVIALMKLGTPFADAIDMVVRGTRGAAEGAAGLVAGTAQDLGLANAAEANRLQRDVGVLEQFPGEPGINPAELAPRAAAEETATRAVQRSAEERAAGPVTAPEVRPARPEPAATPTAAPSPQAGGERGAAASGAQASPQPAPAPTPLVQVARPNSNVRLLPVDAPHLPPVVENFAARRSAGAAGAPGQGPLQQISPLARRKLDELIRQEGWTPDTLDQRIEEMSAHEFLGELSPSTALHMSALNGTGGGARNEIYHTVKTRGREAPERMASEVDAAFGPVENRFQLQKAMEIDRDQSVRKFWDRFRKQEIPPTPAIQALLPRLEASGALQAANKALAEEGLPASNGFQRLGTGEHVRENTNIISGGEPPAVTRVPTASAFQYAKEYLDDLIEKNMENPGGANAARRYTQLKNDLVKAVDDHPDQAVAGLWKDARDRYAGPTQIIKAMKLGERILTGNVGADELPFLTASFSPTEMRAVQVGMRGRVDDLFGRPGKTDRTVMNTVLAPSNQKKIRWVIGDEKADRLFAAIEHEQRIKDAENPLIHNSMTQPRTEAAKFWEVEPTMLQSLGAEDLPKSMTHGVAMGVKKVAEAAQARSYENLQRQAAQAREEVARIFTLQGPERDAVLRELVGEPGAGPGPASGPALPRFAKGGRPKPGQPIVVGEKRAEVFVPDRPGTVIPGGAELVGQGEKFGLAKVKAALEAMSEKDRATFADDYANEFARRVGEAADPKAVLEAIKGSAAMTEIRVALGRKRADKMVNRMKAQAARPAQKDPQSRQETRP